MSKAQRQSHPVATPAAGRTALWLDLAAAAVLALAAVPCLVGIAPEIHWDVNPLAGAPAPEPPTLMLGPTGNAWLTVLAVAAAGAALAAHLRAGGGLDWVSLALALVGSVFAVWHMPRHAAALFRGGAWLGGAMLGVAVCHLAQHPRCRRFLAGGVLGLGVAAGLHALNYVALEHPATVAMYRQTEAQTIAQRGWEPGSPQHLSYRRRVESPDAIGAFGLSNVFGSVAGAACVLGLVLTVGMLRRRDAVGLCAVGVPTAAAAAALVLSRSRGAMLAALLTTAVVGGVAGLSRGWPPRRRRVALGLVVLGLPALAIAAVLVRASLGPPPPPPAGALAQPPPGERSLLFRSQYWAAAGRLIARDPWTALVGLGPDRFKPAYAQVKDPASPEDVTSTHNVLLDYTVMLGVGGVAWGALLLWWLWRAAGRGIPNPAPDRGASPAAAPLRADRLVPALIAGAIAFGTQYAVIWHGGAMDFARAVMWVAGVGAFVLVTAWFSGRSDTDDELSLGLLAAAAVLLMHNQIEMTFFHQGAVTVGWVLVALAGAAEPGPGRQAGAPAGEGWRRAPAWLRAAIPVVLVLAAAGLVAGYAAPVGMHQSAMGRAARQARLGLLVPAVESLAEAGRALPTDPEVYLAQGEVMAHLAAAAARQGAGDEAAGWLRNARRALDRAAEAGLHDTSLLRLRAGLHQAEAALLRDPTRLEAAAAAWRRAVEREPCNLQNRLALADLLWGLGRRDEAAREYQEVLLGSDRLYLDPLVQLAPARRAEVEARVRAAESRPAP